MKLKEIYRVFLSSYTIIYASFTNDYQIANASLSKQTLSQIQLNMCIAKVIETTKFSCIF